MAVHKDCYSAIDLTQQDGPHRRETLKRDSCDGPHLSLARERSAETVERNVQTGLAEAEGHLTTGLRRCH